MAKITIQEALNRIANKTKTTFNAIKQRLSQKADTNLNNVDDNTFKDKMLKVKPNLKGDKGDQGDQGGQGPQGPAGPAYDDTNLQNQITVINQNHQALQAEFDGVKVDDGTNVKKDLDEADGTTDAKTLASVKKLDIETAYKKGVEIPVANLATYDWSNIPKGSLIYVEANANLNNLVHKSNDNIKYIGNGISAGIIDIEINNRHAAIGCDYDKTRNSTKIKCFDLADASNDFELDITKFVIMERRL